MNDRIKTDIHQQRKYSRDRAYRADIEFDDSSPQNRYTGQSTNQRREKYRDSLHNHRNRNNPFNGNPKSLGRYVKPNSN